jgi:sucrose-6-phosphate hydrolase SacC (GH32 family)
MSLNDFAFNIFFSYNPVIDSNSGRAVTGRDPTTAWRHSNDPSHWYMAYGTSPASDIGAAVVFRSTDLTRWIEVNYLHQSLWTGMWECPDFFSFDGSTYLLKVAWPCDEVFV